MRSTTYFIFIILLLLGISSTADAARLDYQAANSPTFDTMWDYTGSASQSTSRSLSSPYSAKVYTDATIYQIIPIKSSSIDYTLYAYKDPSVAYKVYVELTEYYNNDTIITTTSREYPLSTNYWGAISGTLTLNPNTEKIKYSIRGGGGGISYVYIDNAYLWVNEDTVTSSESFHFGAGTAEFSFPKTQSTEYRYYWQNITWANYSSSPATATINGAGVTVSDSGSYLTISAQTYINDSIKISKNFINEITVSPTDGATIPIEYPYNTINMTWESTADNYTIIFSPTADYSSEWVNESTAEKSHAIYLNPGTYYWKIINWDKKLNCWQKTESSFTISNYAPTPGNLKIWAKDELNDTNISTFDCELSNSTSTISKSTTTGIIEYTGSEILSGEYIAKISAPGYYPRTRVLQSPTSATAYLSNSTDTSLISFNIIDYTNKFQFSETRLQVTRTNNNGGQTISDAYFDAGGTAKTYLINDNEYQLELITDDYTKSTGAYTPTGSASVSLVVGDIPLVPNATTFGGFNYSISKTNTSVSISWSAPANSLTEEISFQVWDENNTLVYNTKSLSPAGTSKYTYANPEKQYKISVWANTTGGVLKHTEYVSGKEKILDLQLSTKWENMFSIFILLVVGLVFGARSAATGALLTSLLAAGLYGLGVLHVSILIVALVVALGVIAVMRGR